MNDRIIIDEKETIHINRGDKLLLEYSIQNDDESDYVFQEGDIVTFGIYKVRRMEQAPLLYKEFRAVAGETSVEISLTSEEMRIEEYINRPKEYWYEIQLNNEQTTTGYDQTGEKILKLYPEGMVPDVES